ncbi:hypothetical protein J437_LFUL012537 [Ladona fulva]|uniref:HAT C-terminal dimerisation domain-containing protein n=1 Tax=Ladona fulva TaxID=123851 RepID=A0A8K0KFK8_LADFU|nr:hypothetical protein J437_LFUL012537 [Ladona fulva]
MAKEKQPLKLKMDVITRWNSTYLMLKRMCDIQEAVKATLRMLRNPEWNALREMCSVMKPFEEVTEELSSKKTASVSKIIVIAQVMALIELGKYIEEPLISRKENPLVLWEARKKYPRLSTLAQKHLAVVATSVPSERVFSKAGQIISERRSRLKSSTAQKLIYFTKMKAGIG